MASLPHFNLIVAIDANGGIAKNGSMPWNHKSDMKFFRDTTIGAGKNAVIMGRVTYESIPPAHRPLNERLNVVVSSTWRQEDKQGITVVPTFVDALVTLGNKRYDTIWVIGGETLYLSVIKDYLYLCDKMFITRFKTDYGCDKYFPWDEVKNFPKFQDELKTQDYTRYYLKPSKDHQEYRYINLLREIYFSGDNRADRTGVGTKSMFAKTLEFDISERIPLLTVKKMVYESVLKELLFFVSGSTDTKELEAVGVNYWRGNTSRKFLDDRKLNYQEGDMGPMYGWQWRFWGAEYEGAHENYTGKGIDQLRNLICGLRDDPLSRRHIMTCLNVADFDRMVLYPCHHTVQFYVSSDRQHLDCMMHQRSGDMALGVPTNIFMYAVLTYMIAHVCNYKPRKLTITIGDAHIYNSHASGVERMLDRTPRPWATLRFKDPDKIRDIDQFKFDNFIIENYTSWPFIQLQMAV